MWLRALRFKHNLSVVRFLVKQACLSAISRTGFNHGNINWGSFPATLFKGDLIKAIPSTGDSEIFFIPKDPFLRDIDALYLKVDDAKKTALVVPIQITSAAKEHADSEAGFYSRWDTWLDHFNGYQVKTAFVRVVANRQSWVGEEEGNITTRSCSTLISPEHEQIIITVADISPSLGLALASRQW